MFTLHRSSWHFSSASENMTTASTTKSTLVSIWKSFRSNADLAQSESFFTLHIDSHTSPIQGLLPIRKLNFAVSGTCTHFSASPGIERIELSEMVLNVPPLVHPRPTPCFRDDDVAVASQEGCNELVAQISHVPRVSGNQ